MSDKILYSDLFADDILAKIQELKNGIKDLQGEYGKLKGELQSKAIELKINLSKQGLNLNELGELANQVDKLSKAIKILDDAQIQAAKASKVAEQAERERIKTETELEKLEQQRLRTEQAKNKQQRDNNKLTDEEKARVEALSQQIEILLADKENLAKADRETIKYIEVEKQSYNELTQVYNVLKNALNKVTGEERKQNVVLAEMEKQAKSVYEQMNNLQKATGKHTLNVGNYQSAFDGLGWSVRNVVRELPALGINLNTFFLAISNNIPIVIDEIKRFNEEQKKVAEAIANGTAEAGTQVQSVGKKIISTVLSWQTLLIVGITVLT
jgi:chromosome segregation ATPase